MFNNHNKWFNLPSVIMYNITFSINIEVFGHFYEFVISILLNKLALTVVKDVFCDVNCLKDIENLAIILVPLIMILSRGHTGQIKG